MLETKHLFIGSREGFVWWHPCMCHIGDMQAILVVKYSKFAHTCVRKLEKKSGRQEYKGECVGMPSHTCVSTHLG